MISQIHPYFRRLTDLAPDESSLYKYVYPRTQEYDPMLVYCWSTQGRSIVYRLRRWPNFSCLLGTRHA